MIISTNPIRIRIYNMIVLRVIFDIEHSPSPPPMIDLGGSASYLGRFRTRKILYYLCSHQISFFIHYRRMQRMKWDTMLMGFSAHTCVCQVKVKLLKVIDSLQHIYLCSLLIKGQPLSSIRVMSLIRLHNGDYCASAFEVNHYQTILFSPNDCYITQNYFRFEINISKRYL